MPDKIRFTAPTMHFDWVKMTIEAIIHKTILKMDPVEQEISDENKIRFK